MAVRSEIRKPWKNLKTSRRVTTLRPERSYSATKYDASPAKTPKIVRRQFGRSYDQKKVRNSFLCRRRLWRQYLRKSNQENAGNQWDKNVN
jgi:hypothetical protein